MIVKADKFIFIHIPKTSGTSINIRLIAKYNINASIQNSNHPFIIYDDNMKVKKTEWHFTYDQAYMQFPDYKYYTVIRHPVDRWVSIYKHYLMRGYIQTGLEEWTERVIRTLPRLDFFDNKEKFESVQSFINIDRFFKPQWMYYREPEVEVHRLEDQTIWKALDLEPQHVKKGVDIPPFDRNLIYEMIYNLYKKDFERWQTTE